MNRRTYLSAALVAGLAGCSNFEEVGETESDDSEGDAPESSESDGSETFDDFEDLNQWETRLGSASADEDRFATGTQSARLESGDDNQIRIVRELSEPRDFAGMRPSLAVAAAEEEADIVVQLLDTDDNRVDFRQRILEGTPLVRTDFGVGNVDGDPDLGAVNRVQIVRWTGEDDKGSIWVDDLRFTSAPDTGKVMLQFDGGYETDYTGALPTLEEYEYPATTFITPGRVREDERDEGDHLLREQIAALADAGWTIASHSMHGADLTDLSSDRDPETEISDAIAWLEDNGFEDGARYFSYPFGRYDGDALEAVADHHDLAFAGRYPSQGAATNPHLCSRVADPDAAAGRSVLDLTAEMGGITALAFGQLDEDSLSTLEETVDHLHELESAGELEVISPQDVVESFVR